MTPTPKLRFVERVIAVPATDGAGRTVRVLQQLWIPDNDTYEEWLKTKDGVWRDVPLEKE
jgi:hypothetical protein